MTEKQQKRFYFPAWRSCSQQLDWIMSRGRLAAAGADTRKRLGELPEPARSAMEQVLNYAEVLAAKLHGAVTAEDLRHGCNLVATGGKKSSSGDMTNTEVDRVVTLFKLLENPLNIEASIAWLAYQRGEDPGAVKRILYFIKHAAPEAYVRKIAADRFGTRRWENMDLGQLKQLAMMLSVRKAASVRPIEMWMEMARPHPGPLPQERVEEPF
jgi:hypothetical protein